MVQHRRTFLQHLYELPHVYNFLEEVVFSIQRRPGLSNDGTETLKITSQLYAKKKNFGDLWKNIFRIVTQPREQSQTSTSRTNAWREAFGKCSMPNRNPSQHTHSPKARAGGHDIVKFTGKPFWRRTFVKKKPFRVVGSFFVV